MVTTANHEPGAGGDIMTTVRLTITRACCVAGERVEPGAELELAPLAAAGLIDAGCGALLDATDAETLIEARSEEIRRQAQAPAVWGQTQQAAEQQLRAAERAARPLPIGFLWPGHAAPVQAEK